MKTLDSSVPVSTCRYCQHYNPTGRRGGSCQMLNVSVQATWKACPLSSPQFKSSWQGSETIVA